MAKRTIDTSGFFRSLAAVADESQNDDVETISETKVQATEAEQKSNEIEQLSVAEPVQNEPVSKPKQAAENKPKHAKKAENASKNKSVNDKQNIKLGFYLTPNTFMAMKLHKAVNGFGSHKDSQIINAALTQYLASEIEALKIVGDVSDDDVRFAAALKNLLS